MTIGNEDAFVDITDVTCPVTFVKVLSALEELDDGQLLRIRINSGEAMNNVPRSLKGEGHLVTSIQQNGDGTFDIVVKKDGLLHKT